MVAVLGDKSPFYFNDHDSSPFRKQSIIDFVLVVPESKNIEANRSRIDVVWGYG